MNTKDVLALALKALERAVIISDDNLTTSDDVTQRQSAITAIKQAQQAQEPVAHSWVYVNKYGLESVPASLAWCQAAVSRYGGSMFPLYAAPKQVEPTECNCCYGTGRIVRDPDIGTDQECFCCNGEGVVND
jgi:hypothetical protein